MQQVIVTIGPKSQVVIPKQVRKQSFWLKPGKKVIVRSLDESSVIVQIAPQDWVSETYGMHKDIWQGVDASAYIRKLRQEWEHKVK